MFKMIDRAKERLKNERSLYGFFIVVTFLLEKIFGRIRGTLLGWPEGYLGAGSRIVGTRHISMGRRASIGRSAWIEAVFSYQGQQFRPLIKIGNGFAASERLHISCANSVHIGDNCLVGSGVYIGDHNHGIYHGIDQSCPSEPPSERKLVGLGSVVIGNNVWMGDNVVIVGTLKIGNGVVIGANSVVTQDLPDNVIVAGGAARILKRFDTSVMQWKRTIEAVDLSEKKPQASDGKMNSRQT